MTGNRKYFFVTKQSLCYPFSPFSSYKKEKETPNEQIIPKCYSNLYKSLENVSRGIFRTQSNIYDGVFLWK